MKSFKKTLTLFLYLNSKSLEIILKDILLIFSKTNSQNYSAYLKVYFYNTKWKKPKNL